MRAIVAALLALGACTDDQPPEPEIDLGGPLVARTMRVIATSVGVQLFIIDPQSASPCSYGHFAEPGTCVNNSDGRACSMPSPGSCLRYVALERDGLVLSEWSADPLHDDAGPYWLRVSHIAPPTHLAIRGCGGTDRVPIRISGPQPAVMASRTSDNHVHVSWTTDRPAATSIVESDSGEMCHTAATEIELQLARDVYVTAFDPVEHVPTIWGVLDVYSGHIAAATVQQ